MTRKSDLDFYQVWSTTRQMNFKNLPHSWMCGCCAWFEASLVKILASIKSCDELCYLPSGQWALSKGCPLTSYLTEQTQMWKTLEPRLPYRCRVICGAVSFALGTPIENHLGELWSILKPSCQDYCQARKNLWKLPSRAGKPVYQAFRDEAQEEKKCWLVQT